MGWLILCSSSAGQCTALLSTHRQGSGSPEVPQLSACFALEPQLGAPVPLNLSPLVNLFLIRHWSEVFSEHLMHPGLVDGVRCGGDPAHLILPIVSWQGGRKIGVCWGACPHLPSTCSVLFSSPPPTSRQRALHPAWDMGRKKIQISRILDQRNRQVSSLGGTVAGGKAFLAEETQPGQRLGHLGELQGNKET